MTKEKSHYGNRSDSSENNRQQKTDYKKYQEEQVDFLRRKAEKERTSQVVKNSDQGRDRKNRDRAGQLVQVRRVQRNNNRTVVVQATPNQTTQVLANEGRTERAKVVIAQLRRSMMSPQLKKLRRAAFRFLGGVNKNKNEKILKEAYAKPDPSSRRGDATSRPNTNRTPRKTGSGNEGSRSNLP